MTRNLLSLEMLSRSIRTDELKFVVLLMLR